MKRGYIFFLISGAALFAGAAEGQTNPSASLTPSSPTYSSAAKSGKSFKLRPGKYHNKRKGFTPGVPATP